MDCRVKPGNDDAKDCSAASVFRHPEVRAQRASKDAARAPRPYPSRAAARPPQDDGEQRISFSRRASAPELCHLKEKTTALDQITRGSGAPRGASNHGRPVGGGSASDGTRSPFGAPPRLSSRALSRPRAMRFQAALRACDETERTRALPARSHALKRGTSRPGPNAGGVDARNRPGAACMAPPAGTALAPQAGSTLARQASL